MSNRTTKRLGWVPDLPDRRDLLLATPIEQMTNLPPAVDLRPQDVAPIYDQGELGSCTAQAIADALRFTLRKQGLADVDPSRLYIYYKERQREGSVRQDSGAQIRDGFHVVAHGFIPEATWPYDPATFAHPPRHIVALDAEARADHVVKYLRVLRGLEMRACLAAGYPFVFGITVYDSFMQATDGEIPMPLSSESVQGGHALLCVGYDDSTQLYTFRNSWSAAWGQQGYGTLPYEFLHDRGLSSDFWTVRTVVEQ